MEELVFETIKNFLTLEVSNKTLTDEKEIVVFLSDGTKAKITTRKM